MQRERGFSLIELMVAMVMTLIVSGAIYGLMASGQGAFQREPALIDRQQNIRVAMDLIVRDLENAGAGMSGSVTPTANVVPPLSQIFTTGLNGVGIAGAINAGQNSDVLEFFTADGSCPAFGVCAESTSTDLMLTGTHPLNGCMGRVATDSFFAYVSGPTNTPPMRSNAAASLLTPGIMFVSFQGDQNLPCTNSMGTGNALRVRLSTPAAPGINSGAACNVVAGSSPCMSLVRVSRVRYELAGENPNLPASFGPPNNALPLNPPCLWRSEYGRFNRDGTGNTGPNSPAGTNNPWEMVARGIDDLQIDYQAGSVPMVDFNPGPGTGPLTVPPVVPANPTNTDTVVRRVRVTLSARAIMPNERGGSRYATNAAGEPGRRGQLTTIVTPRPALATLAVESDATRNWR